MAHNPNIYLGNPNLPSGNAQFQYTPEMVKELQKCEKDILHFAENHFFITNLDEGKQRITLHRPQKRILKSLVKHNRVVTCASRQTGKSTIMTIYALWLTLFKNDMTVLIVANKEATAIEILRRIRMAYEYIPNWLKSGVKEWGKTAVVFSNDSRIIISSTSSSASRGQTANCISGEEVVTIKHKTTGEIMDITMNDLAILLEAQGETINIELTDDDYQD